MMTDDIQKLQALTLNDVKKFSLDGLIVHAKCVDVYDGDTCQCIFFLHGEPTRFSIRILGIDTPELRTGMHKEEAKEARDVLRTLILDNIVKLHCHKWDKYGRLLADIETIDGVNVSAYMIQQGHAVAYDGGKKSLT
jgi:endonuclease YncB( thermonuclease family)